MTETEEEIEALFSEARDEFEKERRAAIKRHVKAKVSELERARRIVNTLEHELELMKTDIKNGGNGDI